jgi:opacity protein-like surface antigen
MNRFFICLLPSFIIGIAFAKGSVPQETSTDPVHSSKINTLSVIPLSENKQSESSTSSLYLQFNTSGLYPSLTDWKNQLHMPDGTHPSGTNIVFGAEAGCVINRYIQVDIGYEFFFTTKVSTIETTGDQINSTYFYGSVRGSMPLESIQNLSLFGSIDVGSLTATEVMENYYGQNFNKTGSATAYRLMAGAQYFMTENWSIMAGAGYFLGKIHTVTVEGQTWPNFSLDLSGFVLRFAVNYHIPL